MGLSSIGIEIARGIMNMMNNAADAKARSVTALLPNSAICFNFVHDGTRLKKSTWMVPHVVRHKDDTDVVSWRCNWGNTCESDCFYARAREQVT